ncbi:hypothetical protein SUGI_0465870 [Cryptomeria japonica]|nr:hypothetical protein SUGI_0465870 [Cryptomeria japonica]
MFGGIGLRMHDHLRDLGREMALELSSPKRLWHPRDLESLQFTGLKTILAKINARCFHSIHDNSLGCRVTFFLGQSDSCVEMSASLLWLKLDGPSFGAIESQASFPSWIPLQNLQCLKIWDREFKTLFENRIQGFAKIRRIR